MLVPQHSHIAITSPPVGRYRVFYTIEEERLVVQIDHVARLP